LESNERFIDAMTRPAAYFIDDLKSAIGFVIGFDAALDWQFLLGFREWLAAETGEPESVAWPVSVERTVEHHIRETDSASKGEGERVRLFFELLESFLGRDR
jgi:hypothetical protein